MNSPTDRNTTAVWCKVSILDSLSPQKQTVPPKGRYVQKKIFMHVQKYSSNRCFKLRPRLSSPPSGHTPETTEITLNFRLISKMYLNYQELKYLTWGQIVVVFFTMFYYWIIITNAFMCFSILLGGVTLSHTVG